MKTLAVVSRKGGAGKTTVAVNLLLAARLRGVKAVLADADPLRSASEVLAQRKDAAKLLLPTSPTKLYPLQQACRRSGVELLIIDTPAAPENDVMEAVKLADLCLAVSRPTYLDLAAAVRSMSIVRHFQRQGMVVLNQCAPPRLGVEPPAVQKAFEALGIAKLEVAPVALRQRMAYQNAFSMRRAVTEADAGDVASQEVLALFKRVWKFMREQDAAITAANDRGHAGYGHAFA